jgi:hypothetical protein
MFGSPVERRDGTRLLSSSIYPEAIDLTPFRYASLDARNPRRDMCRRRSKCPNAANVTRAARKIKHRLRVLGCNLVTAQLGNALKKRLRPKPRPSEEKAPARESRGSDDARRNMIEIASPQIVTIAVSAK